MTTCPGRAPSAVAGCLRGSWVWRERGADVLGSRGLGGPGGSGPAHVQQGPPAGASPRAGSMPLTCPLPHPLCPQASARPVCGASSRKPVPGPPASCTSTRSTPWARGAPPPCPASPTRRRSRRSTSCWWRWTVSAARAGSQGCSCALRVCQHWELFLRHVITRNTAFTFPKSGQ